ncbi:MAG: tetratricopeptide repeat protein [Deltaproteobacteria bacterium]|jgi:tetratricopeptide (TPR) repeat protein|nr:tetratricopeptide repeat protein [Deltaproteobacteria bacterium]
MAEKTQAPSRTVKILIILATLTLSLWAMGCNNYSRAGSSKVADSYYYFLKSQYEELSLRDKEAIASMEKAVEAVSDSSYLNVEAAKLLSRTGRAAEASDRAARAIEQDPGNVEARLLSAWLAAGSGQFSDAEAQYAEILKLDPLNEEALTYIGSLYAETGRMDQALATFSKLAESYPDLFLPDYYLGRLAQARVDLKTAVRHYKRSLDKNPFFSPALAELAVIYEAQNKLKLAEDAYRRLIKLQPDNATALQARLAHILLKTGRRSQAEDILKSIAHAYPSASDSARASLVLGLAYIDEGMIAEAGKEFDKALEQDPGNETLLFLQGSVMKDLGQTDRAQSLLRSVSPASRYYVDATFLLCNIFLEKGQRSEAVALLAKARSLLPAAAPLVLAHGTLYEEEKMFQEAKEVYVGALKDFPEEAEIRFRLAFVEDMLGDKSASIKYLRQTLKLDPNHPEALNYLAYTWAEMKENLDEALVMALKADALSPNNGHIVDTVAWIYYNMNDLAKALPLLEKAARLSDEDPVILEHLGDALLKIGRPAEAKQIYAKAIERGHKTPAVINEKLQSIEK